MTANRARNILEHGRGLDGMSKINPAFTRGEIWDVLWGAVRDLGADQKIRSSIAKNIGREFGRYYLARQAV